MWRFFLVFFCIMQAQQLCTCVHFVGGVVVQVWRLCRCGSLAGVETLAGICVEVWQVWKFDSYHTHLLTVLAPCLLWRLHPNSATRQFGLS